VLRSSLTGCDEEAESTVGQVWLLTNVCFVRVAPNGTVPQPILELHGV
jgi:hypothetical protein